MIPIRQTDKGVTFAVRVVPRSPLCSCVGILNEAIKIRITAPPLQGKANDECIRFLADRLKIRTNQITIIAGKTNMHKRIALSGLTCEEVEQKLKVLLNDCRPLLSTREEY